MNTSQQSPIEPAPSVDKKLTNKVIILVLIIGGIIGVQFYRPNSVRLSNESNISVVPTAGAWYTTNTENLRFIIPAGWAVHSDFNPSLPIGFKNPAFVLQKTGSACTIVEAKLDTAIADARKQISFADTVFSNYTQFDGDWWLASTGDSEKYSFSENTRQYAPGEFRMSANLQNDPFILFMNDGTSVPDDCNNDFNAMLKTVEPYYKIINLTSSSKGTITTGKIWDHVASNATNKSYEHLLFTADNSKEKQEVMKIPTDTWAGNFFVLGGKLYIPSNLSHYNDAEKTERFDSAIYTIDLFTGKTSQISGTAVTDSYISSLYVRDGVAYYLAGNSTVGTCLVGYHPCATDLYSIPLGGGKPALIAHSSLGGSILGYVEGEKAFYVQQDWGDAGCVSTFINKIVNGKEEVVGKFEGCVGDDEASNVAYKQMQEKVNVVTTKANAGRISSKGIRIENGTLQPTSGDISGDAIFSFDK